MALQTFSEELRALRRERSITQEQLAQALNVSRTTISRWESGKALPDIETARQLSKILNHNFFAKEEAEEEESPVQAEAPSVPRRRHWWIGVLLAVCLLAVGAALLPGREEPVAQTSPAPVSTVNLTSTIGQQRQPSAIIVVTPSKQVAYLDVIAVEDGVPVYGWRVDYHFENQSDVPFTIEKIEGCYYENDVLRFVIPVRYAELRPHMKHDELRREDGPLEWSFSSNQMNITHCIVTIYGTDANGHRLNVSVKSEYSRTTADEAYGP